MSSMSVTAIAVYVFVRFLLQSDVGRASTSSNGLHFYIHRMHFVLSKAEEANNEICQPLD